MFDPDVPVQKVDDDRLGRKDFAKSLASAILAYNQKDSLAIGLYGSWGSGKTSVINMALDYISLENPNGAKARIVRFEPWNFSDQGQLIGQFFKRLSQVLKRKDDPEQIKRIGERIEA